MTLKCLRAMKLVTAENEKRPLIQASSLFYTTMRQEYLLRNKDFDWMMRMVFGSIYG